MKTSCEGIGKNIEQAINNALFELKATREDVDIKILEEGGFFKKAKVLVTISEDSLEKYQTRRERAEQECQSQLDCECENCQCQEHNAEVAECECQHCDCQECDCENDEHCECECQIEDKKESLEQEVNELSDLENCKAFIEGFLESAGIGAGVDYEETQEDITVKIEGEKAGNLIGYRGDSINALQYLISVYVAKHNRHAKKIRLDINSYRAKREQSLIALANRVAKKVEKTGYECKLEPMPASERRIIHLALQDNEKVTTISKGVEPKRYLIIQPK